MRIPAVLVFITFLATAIRGEPVPDTNDTSSAADSAIAANILIVKSHAEIASWVVSDPTKRQGDVGRMRTVRRGMKIYLPLIATFSQSQVGKRIALTGFVQVVSPNGNTLGGFRCFAIQVDPRAPKTIVLEPVVDITFDATDPSGEYRVRGSIRRDKETAVASETFHLQ